MIYRTKNSDFELFKKEALKWQEILGLKEWSLHFDWLLMDSAIASVCYHVRDMAATVRLNKKLRLPNGSDVKFIIRRAAFHELMYLVTARLACIAVNRSYDEEEWTSYHHALIRMLENTLFTKY